MESASSISTQRPRPDTRSHFRFFNPPKELRLEVYDWLPYLCDRFNISVPLCKGITRAIAITCAPIPPVYLTCRLVHDEYAAVVDQPKGRKLMRDVPLLAIPAPYARLMATGVGLIESQDNAGHCTGVVGEVMNCLLHDKSHWPARSESPAELQGRVLGPRSREKLSAFAGRLTLETLK